jgi:small ligand-binding sensory domain FIST
MRERSFSVIRSEPEPPSSALKAVRRELTSVREAVPKATGGIVFASGDLAQQAESVAEAVADVWEGIPALVVPAAGVLTEEHELEGATAVSGILWAGGSARVVVAPDPAEAPRVGALLAEAAKSELDAASGTVLVFVGSDGLEPDGLAQIARALPRSTVAGAGAAAAALFSIDHGGEVISARAAALAVSGLASPLVDASPACRLLTPFMPVDEALSGMVLRLGGRTALEQLSTCGPRIRSGKAQPMVFAALSPDAANPEPERFLLRPLRGIDPQRGGVLIGPDARRGVRLAFGVRDPAASREDLERMARRLERQSQGAALRFGLYLSCVGRGRGLYGAQDVDVRILRRRFPQLPIAGMHSSFEIASWGPGEPQLQLFTGVLALFRSLS